ncbi:uncharacterized protein LOC126967307 [Leptidea sinapis]|uniref:uncharacterized protein LOC126967307 n=1 Tax=Leptidea sinapis TaxID=189913 RepID=UPI0021C3DD1F|nr:uncharacterized protein LOC126967307 [Leptidea sinapis]
MAEMVEVLTARTAEEESRQLRDEARRLSNDNNRLRARVTDLENDLKAMRREFSERKAVEDTVVAEAPSSEAAIIKKVVEGLKGDLARTIGEMMDAKLAGIEDRLLPAPVVRPPLAAATRQVERSTREEAPQGPPVPAANPQADSWTKVAARGKKKRTQPAPTTVNTTLTAPANPAPQAQAGIRRIRATESTKPVEPVKSVKPTKGDGLAGSPKAKVSLRPPSTAAVVITLSKDAVAGEATYAWALTAAKQRVSLADIGVKEVRTRKTALGSRILEIGGPERSQQADRLAEEIRGALVGIATVNRPVKSVDIRISGLEDSVTLDDVVGAVAARGNVPREHVRAGRISMGSTIVKCPTTAAKAIMQDRLCIGWSTVRVTLLEARPLRCFRCYGIGHGSATCTAKDRSGLCCRCGGAGHLAQSCTEEPRCDVCADAGAPAGHRMGGRRCNPPLIKRNTPRTGVPAPAMSMEPSAPSAPTSLEGTVAPQGELEQMSS